MISEKLLLTFKESQDILNVGRNKMLELMHSKDFPSLKLGNKWYVNRGKLQLWLDERTGGN